MEALRLNGPQRIGVVVSVLWIIGGGTWGNSEAIREAAELTELQVNNCVEANKLRLGDGAPFEQTWTPCWKNFQSLYLHNVEEHWTMALIVAFVPIPIAWFLAWAGVSVIRWVRRGYQTA